MRLIFMGSPPFALPTLRGLVQGGHDVRLVVTQPDRPVRRSGTPQPPPVARLARELGLPIHQPERLRSDEALAPLRQELPEAIVVAAYGLILPRAVLELAPHGCLNVHPSLLPRWRGASPVQATLLAGDPETGVTIIRLTSRMDAGPILAQRREPVLDTDTAESLEARLAERGAELLVHTLDRLQAGPLHEQEQEQDESLASYCGRLERADAQLNWQRPAAQVWRQVRAFRARGDAFTLWEGKVLKVLDARPLADWRGEPGRVSAPPGPSSPPVVATAEGGLALLQVQLEGKRPTDGASFRRGHPAFVGAQLPTPALASEPLVE